MRAAEPLEFPAAQGADGKAFRERLWALADNEFEFKRAAGQIFYTTFHAPTAQELNRFAAINTVATINAIMDHGGYDFDQGSYALTFDWWYDFQDAFTADGTVFPRDLSRASTSHSFKIDPAAAEKWRNAIEQKQFEVTVWYRLKSVEHKSRWVDPHSGSSFSYELSFDIEVVRFKASASD